MAKPNHEREPDDKKGSPSEAAAWGTWEELLLAYAVNRFGNSWDSVSSELRKRSSTSIVFTPKNCKQKFQELERRFTESNGNDVDIQDAAAAVPWIEQLRKLRVAELQLELQNYDIYISSLQSKVKKLTEESDKNNCGERKEKSDLGQIFNEIEIKNAVEANKKPPDLIISGQKQVPGVDESDRDNQSMNGSNGNLETGADRSENESTAVHTVNEKPGSSPHSLIGVKDSCDGRSDAKEPVKTEPDWGASQEPESIAESKSDETVKENSDVQSSASKSRKERSDRVRRGNSKVDEQENDNQSRNSIPVRSLPLIEFLQKLHNLGSAVFERRLDRQEKLRYKNLIREYIDFEILQTRLKEGWYSDGNNKFFRDLLLLVNNTCIFFSNESPESVAAIKLRQFILNEMTSSKKQITDSKSAVKLCSSTLPPKRALESPDSKLLKPKLVAPMNACRKRSSISANASDKVTEKETAMKSGFASISKRTGKNVCDASEAHLDQELGKTSASEISEVNSDTKKKKNDKKPIESEEKKRSAAKFLNRMIETSTPFNNEVVGVAAGDSSENNSRGGSQKRGGANKGDEGKKHQAPKRTSGGRQLKEPESPTNRSVGQPAKKAAAPPPAAALGKRNREWTEPESSVSKQAKKRSKRL